MTSGIQYLQNQPENLLLLAAQRQLYTEAKRGMSIRLIFAVIIALFPAALAFFPVLADYEHFVSVAAILMTFAFPYFLKKAEEKKVLMAATIQEQFDHQVLGIKWNESLVGHLPLVDEVKDADKRFKGDRSRLKDWYFVPDNLPTLKAVVLCQKSNLVWDYKQRKFYMNFFLVLAFVLLVGPLTLAACNGLSVKDYLVKILFPTLPLLALCIDNYLTHREIVNEQEPMAKELNHKFATNAPISDDYIRITQDAIFNIRKKHALVPNWMYNFFIREKFEDNMKEAAK